VRSAVISLMALDLGQRITDPRQRGETYPPHQPSNGGLLQWQFQLHESNEIPALNTVYQPGRQLKAQADREAYKWDDHSRSVMPVKSSRKPQ